MFVNCCMRLLKCNVFCCVRFNNRKKYTVISFCGTSIPTQQYEIVPANWMLSDEKVVFPMYERCKLEKHVEQLEPPLPRKDFKKYSSNILHSTGKFVLCHLCCKYGSHFQ